MPIAIEVALAALRRADKGEHWHERATERVSK
jgi:hypothetical protein